LNIRPSLVPDPAVVVECLKLLIDVNNGGSEVQVGGPKNTNIRIRKSRVRLFECEKNAVLQNSGNNFVQCWWEMREGGYTCAAIASKAINRTGRRSWIARIGRHRPRLAALLFIQPYAATEGPRKDTESRHTEQGTTHMQVCQVSSDTVKRIIK
jgi:hypothetical protein